MTSDLAPPTGLAFAGDGLLAEEVKRLISRYGIRSAVETGTYQGCTTRALAAMVPAVYTIEISPDMFAESGERLSRRPERAAVLRRITGRAARAAASD